MTAPYGPKTPYAQLRDDPPALAVIERYLPGIADEADMVLQPYTVLEDLQHRVHAVGDPVADLDDMWSELARLVPTTASEPAGPAACSPS
jgi:hypothetical protein